MIVESKDVLTKERRGFFFQFFTISLRWFAAMPAKEKERETEGEKTKLFLLRATVGVRYLVQLVQGTDWQGVFHIGVRDLI